MKQGESLSQILIRNGLDPGLFLGVTARLNHLEDPDNIPVNRVLALPRRRSKAWQPSQSYRVKGGDTLLELLIKQGWSNQQIDDFALVAQVADQNGIADPDLILVGQTVVLPNVQNVGDWRSRRPGPQL